MKQLVLKLKQLNLVQTILIQNILFFLLSAPCRQPCCTMEVDLVNKFTMDTKDLTSLEIRFPPTIKMYKEIEIYALFNMLAGNKHLYCLSVQHCQSVYFRTRRLFGNVPWRIIL